MKILILGGTGAMGAHLVQLLSGRGADVVVTSRSKRENQSSVRYVQGDAKNVAFLKTILQEHWDVIVDFMVYSTPMFIERVDLLLQATNQYVFLSSARVYDNADELITEDSPRLLDCSSDEEFLSTDEYSLSKARQEDVLTSSGKVNWTIIRPYITYSENRLQLGVLEKEEWLYRALMGKTIVFSSDICHRFTTMTYGMDVAKGIVSIIGNPSVVGNTFHITQTYSYRWGDILEIYLSALAKLLGRRPKVLLLDMESFFYCRPNKYQINYDRLFNRRFNNEKIKQYVDIEGFVAIEKGLSDCVNQFAQNPQFNSINWILMAKMDKLTNEWTSLPNIKGFRNKLLYLKYRMK